MIELPDKSKEKLLQAKVIAVGPGFINNDGKVIPTSVKAGEQVLIPEFGGQNIKINNEEYLLFRDAEILAKIAEN